LLDLNRPADALKEYEATLVTEPNRFRSLYGAARAAERAGDAVRARTNYATLMSLCGNADTERSELREAKAFLAKSWLSRRGGTRPPRRRLGLASRLHRLEERLVLSIPGFL
jgi:predicted Zn-dependent protease